MVWQKTKEKLQSELSESVFNLWIEPLQCLSEQKNTISLACPDRFFSAYISRNYLDTIQKTLKEVDPQQREVVLALGKQQKQEENRGKTTQLRLPNMEIKKSSVRALHPRYTFDRFMIGESNILAQSACRSISMADDSVGPCLYINSTTGLGKSHLTHAVAHHILADSPATRLHYLTAQQFSSEMVKSIQANTMDAFKQKYHDNCDILLVEDVHSLTGKKKTQEELNELLDSLIKCGKRVVFTANKSPRELAGIDEEFRSRMTSGLVTAIQPPDLSTRTRIVKNKAMLHSISLEDEHADYLAHHIKGDVRQIESAIVSIRAKAQLNEGEGQLDMQTIEQVVASIVGNPQMLSAAMIREFICKQYKLSCSELQSRSRKRVLTFPRQVAMYLCRMHTEQSLSEIGKEFNRDHSTVLHSIKVVDGLSKRNIGVEEQLSLLSKKLDTL